MGKTGERGEMGGMSETGKVGKPFFSVIVPAHNSEFFILRCLSSIIRQTFTDYELIVVCDRCGDNTDGIARTLADKVIITDYGMDGLARNAGIDAAEGEWILFLDDDDWWIHDYVLEELHKAATQHGFLADVMTFDFIWNTPPEGIPAYYKNEAGAANIAVWSKAFRRELIGDTRFPAIRMKSDVGFMKQIVDKKPLCYATHQLMYYYNFMRPGSQTELYERAKREAEE